jgi:hypothetical protein
VKYELCIYIPEGDILHSHRRENPKSYTVTGPSVLAVAKSSEDCLKICREPGKISSRKKSNPPAGGEEREA